jgi:competence protein ComEA
MLKILMSVVIVAFIVIIGFLVIDPDLEPIQNTNPISEVVNDGFKYTIEGEVNKAGTYVLSEGITMEQLISAAGGVTANADDLAYFPTAVLKNNTTYYIAPKFDSNDICSTTEIKKVNINEDVAETLMSVTGITTSIATSIVSYRTGNGLFTTLEDVMNVYGIGNATYHKIRSYIILHS